MMDYGYFVRGQEHLGMFYQSLKSVRKVAPTAHVILVTDDPEIKSIEADSNVALIPIAPGMPIMLANLEAQIAALFAGSITDDIAFLDTDVLLLAPIKKLTTDLMVTWRDSIGTNEDGEKVEGVAAQMPYNYGVLAMRRNQQTIEMMIWMRERIRKMHGSYQKWYGNQVALAELCGARPAAGTEVVTRRIPWLLTESGAALTIEKRPCDVWNYTPKELDEDLAGKRALHFKGGSRKLMQGYAQRLGCL